jgi:vacuolar protein sorting-associated protein IST1
MAIQRLRMLQQKSTAIAKQQRRHMAELLAVGKLESARIRVENIIRSDIATELHEILELYCELLLARIQLLDGYMPPSRLPDADPAVSASADDKDDDDLLAGRTTLDPGLDEAVRSIIYAAPRTDIKELTQARALLLDKMGKDYAASAAAGARVPDRVAKRLRVESPAADLVDAYLREIAKTYAVRFPGDPDPVGLADDDDDQPGDDSALAERAELEPALEAEQSTAPAERPPQVGSPGAALRIAPPSPTTDNVAPKIKMPGLGPRKPTPSARAKDQPTSAPAPGSKIPDVDELERRFAALKKGS